MGFCFSYFTAPPRSPKMNSTTTEELKIPILHDEDSPQVRSICSWFWLSRQVTDPEAAPPSERLDFIQVLARSPFFVPLACVFSVILTIVFFLTAETDMAFDKPDIRLDSVFVCPTNTSNNLVIWDVKFDLKNTNNHSLCIPGFEVSVFSYNRTELLTKVAINPTHTCVGSTSHTSALGLVEDSLQDPNGTIRFDLKFHAQFYLRYDGHNHYPSYGDVVCKDAKVAFSPSCYSCCGCLVGDPFQCSYEL